MRIALMTNNYKPFIGGVPISIERLKKGLEKLGHEVIVFAPTYKDNHTEINTKPCENGVFRYKTLLPKFIGGIVLPNPMDSEIIKEFQKNSYDIIHVHHPIMIGNTAVYLSKKFNIPLVFTYHTRYEQYLFSYVTPLKRIDELTGHSIERKLFPLYLKAFFKQCHHIFVPTRGMAQYLQKICDVKPNKLSVLPTGIEQNAYCKELVVTQEIAAVRKKYHAEEIPLFLSVSRMAKEKNVDFLLLAIKKVKEQYKEEFRVLLVGDGPDKHIFEKQCEELGIADCVLFTGQIPNEEITPYYAAADAFIFASKTETQGIVILEAFAGKTPVFALNASGVSDLVQDGRNGRLCEEDETRYAELLLDILEGRENLHWLSEKAYETALAYQEDRVAGMAVQQYNRVIAEFRRTMDMTENQRESKLRVSGIHI